MKKIEKSPKTAVDLIVAPLVNSLREANEILILSEEIANAGFPDRPNTRYISEMPLIMTELNFQEKFDAHSKAILSLAESLLAEANVPAKEIQEQWKDLLDSIEGESDLLQKSFCLYLLCKHIPEGVLIPGIEFED